MYQVTSRGLVVLVALLSASTATVRAADVDLYLPDDSEMVGMINVRQLFDSAAVQKHFAKPLQSWLDSEPHWREVRKALPLDVTKDVDSIVAAGPVIPRDGKGIAIVRGRFDVVKLQAAAATYARKEPAALTLHKSGSRVIYEFKSSAAGAFGVFLDDGTLAFAPGRAGIDEALARKDGKKRPALSKELQKLIDEADSRQTIWLVAPATAEFKKEFGTSPHTEKLLGSLIHLRGGMTFGDGVQLDFLLQTKDADSAREFRQFTEGVKSILSLAAMDSKENAPLLTKLVGACKVANAKDAVTVKGSLSKAEIEKTLTEKAKP